MTRQSKPLLSKEKVARAALAIIDKKGIDGLTLDLVALKLRVQTPSLYHHFHSKAEVLAEVARTVLIDTYLENRGRAKDWKEALLELQVEARRSMLKHPRAMPLMLHFFPRHLMLEHYDRWIGKIGTPEDLHMVVIEGLEKLTLGSALFTAMRATHDITPMPKFSKERLPYLDAAIQANQLNDEDMFKEMVRRFLSSF